MKNLHFNNSVESKQSLNEFALSVFREITQTKDGGFQISVDDGDGDVYKYTITKECVRVPLVNQIPEN